MKKYIAAIIATCLLFMFGCEKNPIKSEVTNNPSVSVDLLMQHDDCKVYRFEDSGYHHYFVKCSDIKTTTTDGTVPAGKSHRIETINTEQHEHMAK